MITCFFLIIIITIYNFCNIIGNNCIKNSSIIHIQTSTIHPS